MEKKAVLEPPPGKGYWIYSEDGAGTLTIYWQKGDKS